MVLFLMNTNWAQKCQPFFSERVLFKISVVDRRINRFSNVSLVPAIVMSILSWFLPLTGIWNKTILCNLFAASQRKKINSGECR